MSEDKNKVMTIQAEMHKPKMNKVPLQLLFSPMSSQLIDRYFDGKANIKTLAEIKKLKSLEDVFEGKSYCIIFIALRAPNDGHWVVLFRNTSTPESVFYFDSYGRKPLVYVKENKFAYDQDFTLLRLIRSSGKKFLYNGIKYQENNNKGYSIIETEEERKNISTCGRYAVAVAIMNIQANEQKKGFNNVVFFHTMKKLREKHKITFDAIVSNMIDKQNGDIGLVIT